jgi:hypothetical protein
MNLKGINLVLLASSAALLVSCGPQTKEDAQTPAEPQQEAPVGLKNPERPSPTQGAQHTLTPKEQEHLKIEEEGVFDETPPG